MAMANSRRVIKRQSGDKSAERVKKREVIDRSAMSGIPVRLNTGWGLMKLLIKGSDKFIIFLKIIILKIKIIKKWQ